MRLQEIMSTDVVTIDADDKASTAWSRMQRNDIRHLPVTENGRLVGVLSERDLGGRNGAALRRGRTVRELMTEQTTSAKPTTTLRQAANLMRGQLIGSLPVLEDGRIVGIVTATDVLAELGRGSTRPAVRAQRKSMRVPPAGARRAAAKRVTKAKRGQRASKGARRGGKAADDSGSREGRPAATTGRITPTLGRERRRNADSPRRAPMPAKIPRRVKRTAGRTPAEETPAYIRANGSVIDEHDKDYLRRKLGRKLGKFAGSIERTSVRVDDVNGPRGGMDKRCRIKVVLSGMPSVLVEEQHHSVQAAMDRAVARTERAVRQSVQRRRQLTKSGKRGESIPAFG